MTTRAVRDGDDWVITGTKCWITNAGISDLYTVFARTSRRRHRGITAFLVEADWGVQVDKLEHKLGIHGSPTGQVIFDEVRVPVVAPHRRRRRGLPDRDAHARPQPPDDRGTGRRHRPGRARLRRRLHEGAQHVRRPLAEHQGLQWMVADMAMKIEAARGLVYRACALVDEGDPTATSR